jgi:hypothetical protein
MQANAIVFRALLSYGKRTLATDWICTLEDNGYKVYSSPDGRKVERAKAGKFDEELSGCRFLFPKVIEAGGVRIEFPNVSSPWI